MPTQGNNQRHSLLGLIGRQHEVFASAKEAVAQQRLELSDLISALQEGWQAVGTASAVTTEKLQAENEHLERVLDALELGDGRQMLGGQEALLLAELRSLREQLKEKDFIIQAIQGRQEPSPGAAPEGQVAACETELIQCHLELERDRKSLDQKWAELKAEQTELRELGRKTELELSRERAQLARERIELVRVREEIRHELDRAQRSTEVAQQLAPAQRLQEEVNERRRLADPNTETPRPTRDGGNSTRWRTLRSRLEETKS